MPEERDVRRVADDINARLDPAVDVTPPADLEAVYRSLSRQALITLRCAFVLDSQQAGAHPHMVAFCQARIVLLTRVVEEKERPR